jgi:hypothetical protein
MNVQTPFAGALVALALLTTPAFAHDFWINKGHYKSPSGEHCCGPNDCQRVDAQSVSITPRGYHLIGGELIPFAEAQQSEDGEYWRCKRYDGSRRCFFAPQPSS